MKKKRFNQFIFIVSLIAITGAAMAYSSQRGKGILPGWMQTSSTPPALTPGPVKISAQLVQSKVLQGSAGIVSLALTLKADDIIDHSDGKYHNVDMVIVLDRSGSMKGSKIKNARQAVLNLLSNLSSKDRFALITYSDGVSRITDLQKVSDVNRKQLETFIRSVRTGGGTNLGAGLQTGINVLLSAGHNGNSGKVILISDGLANKGITSHQVLGNIAGIAAEKEFAISTVGVGIDFNEQLMTKIADNGAGNYYYLENPEAFAEVVQKEFFYTQTTAVNGISVHLSMPDGISLISAAGYPITVQNNRAVFNPGDLRSNQTRKLFLTLKVPSERVGTFELGKIKVRYLYNGTPFEASLEETFKIACVKDQRKVLSSIDRSAWSQKIIQEDYNRLKQEVAGDIKAGKKDTALRRIKNYYQEKTSINKSVASEEVNKNLDRDLKELKKIVKDTFQGAPSVVLQKQKSSSKALQYEGYRGLRQK
ncbi:MAG: VWA domain-containing protein [Desulfobacterales bacterium]